MEVDVDVPLLVWREGAVDKIVMVPMPGKGMVELDVVGVGETRHRCF